MDDITEGGMFPEWLRRSLSLTLTVLAALLYAAILGTAIVRTFLEPDPAFSQSAERTASLLSGMVGSVVAAGFARGRRPASVPITTDHPVGDGRARTSWRSLGPPSLVRCKFLGLATLIGARPAYAGPWSATEEEAPDLEPGRGWTVPLWIALLYFGVYFLVGAGAFAVTLLRSTTPEFLVNAAWVWLGTVMSSGYSFFALGAQPSPGLTLSRGTQTSGRREDGGGRPFPEPARR